MPILVPLEETLDTFLNTIFFNLLKNVPIINYHVQFYTENNKNDNTFHIIIKKTY